MPNVDSSARSIICRASSGLVANGTSSPMPAARQEILNDLRTWQATRSDASPELMVVSAGSPEASRAMGLRATVLLDADFGTARAFGASGTPSAVLVDQHGRLASEVAVGVVAAG
ncbi:MAG TPA: hypothetical protein VGH53_30935 [Streptosporangiaceae bacterium]|jgi:hypothetical protein